MPRLIRLEGERCADAQDDFVTLEDEASDPGGDIVVSLARFLAEEQALSERPGGRVGVRLEPADEVEALEGRLSGLTLVALAFPRFRDGRPFTSARLLRTRLGFGGEIRAVGDVLRDQAGFMARCGFNAFEPADGSSAEDWGAAIARHTHVYQRVADQRSPAFIERQGG